MDYRTGEQVSCGPLEETNNSRASNCVLAVYLSSEDCRNGSESCKSHYSIPDHYDCVSWLEGGSESKRSADHV